MAYIPDPSGRNPGWLLREGSDASDDDNWWQIPEGYSPDPRNPGWYLKDNSDPSDDDNWVHDPSVADADAESTALLRAVDVASYQPADLTAYIQRYGLDLVVVRLYQRTIEGEILQRHSRAQVESVKANGKHLFGYLWLYGGVDVDRQVNEALDLERPLALALDLETYQDQRTKIVSWPNVTEVDQALNVCDRLGQRVMNYTGQWFWKDYLGSTMAFAGRDLWSANYNGQETLETPTYGGMRIVGHQYADVAPDGVSLDMDVFDPALVG